MRGLMPRGQSRRPSTGFTLIEVLVAVKGRLDDQQRMGDNIVEMRHQMDSLGSKLTDMNNKLDRKAALS